MVRRAPEILLEIDGLEAGSILGGDGIEEGALEHKALLAPGTVGAAHLRAALPVDGAERHVERVGGAMHPGVGEGRAADVQDGPQFRGGIPPGPDQHHQQCPVDAARGERQVVPWLGFPKFVH